MARKLGIDEETVRKRFKRAKELGSLPGWRMMINPRLVGWEAANLDLEVIHEGSKAEAISRARRLEGVTTVLDFQGRGMMVMLYYRNDASLNGLVERVSSISGTSRPVVWKQVFSRPDVEMKKVDWKIIDEMAEDARRDLQEIAGLVGASVRSVQRRLAAMTEGKAIYLVGTPNYHAIAGLVCNFLVFCPDENKKRAVDRSIASEVRRVERSDASPKQHSMFVVACENPFEADKTLKWMRSLDGVEWVRMGVMRELIHVPDWLKVQIARGLSAR